MPTQKKSLCKAIENEIKVLEKIIKDLKELGELNNYKENSIKFNTSLINIENIVKDIPNSQKGCDYIYSFKVCGKNVKNNNFLETLIKTKEKTKEKKDYPKINKDNKNTQYLYVGRSYNLKNRIRQHLGENYKGVYAMHMKRWVQNLEKDLCIEIQYYKFENKEHLFIQCIEDLLWKKFKPACGRKGER